MKELTRLRDDLEGAKNNATRVVEDGVWMKSAPAMKIFMDCLSINNQIFKLLEKGIARMRAQNVNRTGGRF